MYDLEGMARVIDAEKRNVYVQPNSYKLLQNAMNTSEIH